MKELIKSKRLLKTIKLTLVILFLLSLCRMPYNYYEIMRFVGMIGFVLLGYRELEKENKTFMIIWFASAVLINPFFKLALGRTVWNVVDVIWVVLLIVSFFISHNK